VRDFGGYTEKEWRETAAADASDCAETDFYKGWRYDADNPSHDEERAENLVAERFDDLTEDLVEGEERDTLWPIFREVFQREYVNRMRELTCMSTRQRFEQVRGAHRQTVQDNGRDEGPPRVAARQVISCPGVPR
jgi:hypothetical protein